MATASTVLFTDTELAVLRLFDQVQQLQLELALLRSQESPLAACQSPCISSQCLSAPGVFVTDTFKTKDPKAMNRILNDFAYSFWRQKRRLHYETVLSKTR